MIGRVGSVLSRTLSFIIVLSRGKEQAMQDEQDLDYEAAVHLDTPTTEGFYPEWDGPDDIADTSWDERMQAELDACDISKIFDALCDAGVM